MWAVGGSSRERARDVAPSTDRYGRTGSTVIDSESLKFPNDFGKMKGEHGCLRQSGRRKNQRRRPPTGTSVSMSGCGSARSSNWTRFRQGWPPYGEVIGSIEITVDAEDWSSSWCSATFTVERIPNTSRVSRSPKSDLRTLLNMTQQPSSLSALCRHQYERVGFTFRADHGSSDVRYAPERDQWCSERYANLVA